MQRHSVDEERNVGESGHQLEPFDTLSRDTESELDAGRLVWVTPNGTFREVDPGSPVVAANDRSCPKCGGSSSVPTRAREHPACGHVSLDGFVAPGRGLACPKCDFVDESGEAFPIVAHVHSCRGCGRVFDRALANS